MQERFQGDEHVYKTFLYILDMYGKQTKTIKEVNQEVFLLCPSLISICFIVTCL